jgi:hypothetical protein
MTARLSAIVILSALFAGCHGLAAPRWFHPGPANYQRAEARRFDPYPENDVGPSMKEVRPPDFQEGMPEATRSRWTIGR